MRKILFSLCIILLAGSAMANFGGTDDFNDNMMDAGKWITASPGIAETNNRLEYAAAYAENNEEQWDWIANRGSYTENWSVKVDAYSALDPAGWTDEMVNFGIRVKNSADSTDDLFELSFEIAHEEGYGEFRAVISEVTTDGEEGADIQQNIGAINAVTLCISFDATTKTLSAIYDIGGGYVTLSSFSVTNWNMTDTDNFAVYLGFSSESRSVAPGDIYGDNFVAEPTAVNADMDGDGMPDGWEILYFGSITNCDPFADSDNDGHKNWQELYTGSNPTNNQSVLRIMGLNDQNDGLEYIVHWQSESNRFYSLLYTTNLMDGFLPIATNLSATPPENVYTNDIDGLPQGYYRIECK